MSTSSVEHLRSDAPVTPPPPTGVSTAVDFECGSRPLMKIVEPVSAIEDQTKFIDKDFDGLVDGFYMERVSISRHLEERVKRFRTDAEHC